MNLAWVRYQHEKKHKYVLLFLIGEDKGYLVGLLDDGISEGAAQILRQQDRRLDALSFPDRLAWLRQHLPSICTTSLRKIRLERAQIVRKWEIKPEEPTAGSEEPRDPVTPLTPA
jgi:hypothetical protein